MSLFVYLESALRKVTWHWVNLDEIGTYPRPYFDFVRLIISSVPDMGNSNHKRTYNNNDNNNNNNNNNLQLFIQGYPKPTSGCYQGPCG